MTQEHYLYRTDPLFLRNQFEQSGRYGIPIIPKSNFTEKDFDHLRLIGFDKVKSDGRKHANRMVHFFLYDYKFEQVWEKPDADLDNLKGYRAVLTPDFSMYTEMPETMLLYNVFRNRWCGAYFASQGIRVIPTVNFGLSNSFGFCFEGIEKGSVVALSTYMVQGKKGREAQKDFFMAGYNEMLRRIEPEKIICYHEPFPEMAGNIVYVNYELSSWQHMSDDVADTEPKQARSFSSKSYRIVKYGGYVESNHQPLLIPDNRIVKHTGYVVQLGAGSAYGGKWVPSKIKDERYLGKPGSIIRTEDKYVKDTKIGEDGRAIMERHYTDHRRSDKHSNPHDHEIKWAEDGSPRPGPPINYWDEQAPVFKSRKEGLGMKYDRIIKGGSPEENAFSSIADFQTSMRRNAEVEFIYNDVIYTITQPEEGITSISEAYKPETEALYDNSEDLLDHIIEGKKLREIITEVIVTDRTI